MNEPRGLHPVYVLEENELRTVGTYSRFFFYIFRRYSCQSYFVTFFYLAFKY